MKLNHYVALLSRTKYLMRTLSKYHSLLRLPYFPLHSELNTNHVSNRIIILIKYR
jgi:hypothetical protein